MTIAALLRKKKKTKPSNYGKFPGKTVECGRISAKKKRKISKIAKIGNKAKNIAKKWICAIFKYIIIKSIECIVFVKASTFIGNKS